MKEPNNLSCQTLRIVAVMAASSFLTVSCGGDSPSTTPAPPGSQGIWNGQTHATATSHWVAASCGVQVCDWGHKMHDMGEDQLRLCYAEFRKHRVQRHDLQEWDTTSLMHLDLEKWMLILIKT
jgi:hypothetical protein